MNNLLLLSLTDAFFPEVMCKWEKHGVRDHGHNNYIIIVIVTIIFAGMGWCPVLCYSLPCTHSFWDEWVMIIIYKQQEIVLTYI